MSSQTLHGVWEMTTPLQTRYGRQNSLKYGTRRHPWTRMTSRACNAIGTLCEATQRSKSWELRRCATTLITGSKTITKKVSQTQQRLPKTRSNSILVIVVSVDLDKNINIVSRVLEQIKRSIPQKFKEASHPKFDCGELFLKGDLKSKKGRQTIHFQRTTQTKTFVELFLMH